MNEHICKDPYPESERPLKEEIDKLMCEWQKSFDYQITTDGFYPYYTYQNPKILFIGRECLGLENDDYISVLFDAYNEKRVGNKTLNAYKFHRIIFYLAYVLTHHLCEYDDIPYPEKIIDDGLFCSPNGISFAFMNISKISNETNKWNSNWADIWKSINDSLLFIRREIKILNPDVIVAANLDPCIFNLVFENNKQLDWDSYSVKIEEKNILLINNWHFSAPRKPDREYYNVLCNSVKNHSLNPF